MKNKWILLLLLVISLLTGCVSARITSSRVTAYDGGAERVFFKVQYHRDYKAFMTKVLSELERDFIGRNIAVQSYSIDSLSNVDSQPLVLQMITAFQPDLVFEIVQTGQSHHPGYSTPPTFNGTSWTGGAYYPNVVSTEIEFRLLEPGSDKIVWKANMDASSGGSFSNLKDGSGSEKVAKKIIEVLIFDGMILPTTEEAAQGD